MKISKKTEYAILGLVELAKHDSPVSAKDLAVKFHFSEAMEKKVFQALNSAGLVKSVPGIGGGYLLDQAPHKISLLDIISVFESTQLNECATVCPHTKICDISDVWLTIQTKFDAVFQGLTLADLIKK